MTRNISPHLPATKKSKEQGHPGRNLLAPNISNATDPKTLGIYRKLLSIAKIPESNLEHIKDPHKSETLPSGRASRIIYESIVNSRSFDRFGRLIHSNVTSGVKCDIIIQPKLHSGCFVMRAQVAKDSKEKFEESKVEKLTTPTWKIGCKKPVYGPPGLAPPITGMLNSEGNENFFSYDGSWKNGNMDGEGIYKFSDGFTYEGCFHRVPHGRGMATYNGGTVYTGNWLDGHPHGKGRAVYRDWIIYEGLWKEGRRHGDGSLTYSSGAVYKGGFRRGHFHGRGTFTSKSTGVIYVGGFEKGFVAGAGTITYPDGRRCAKIWPRDANKGITIHDAISYIELEWEKEENARIKMDESLFNTLKSVKLEKNVTEVRAKIKEKRRLDKEQAREKIRAIVRDAMAKERERKYQLSLEDDSDL